MPTWNTPKTRNLLNAVLQLKSQDEARRFFRDLLTAEELLEFSRRWQAAQLLNQKVPYTKIVKVTGLSSTTVARVQCWLQGKLGGYRLMLNRLGHHAHASPHSRLKEA
ncbi:MAG: YerC/YecD family TrpR-related protein [Patescibacteria group bacterium]